MSRWFHGYRPSPRGLGGLATGILVALLSLSWLAADGILVHASYDWTHRWFAGWYAPVQDDSPVVLVYLDLESHIREKQDLNRSWDRGIHARLLRRLTQAGARQVVFDIVFESPGPSAAADRELRAAIQENGRTLLGAEIARSSEVRAGVPRIEIQRFQPPWTNLAEVAAGWGVAKLAPDGDYIVRRLYTGAAREPTEPGQPPAPPLLSLSALASAPSDPAALVQQERWVRYYGPPLYLPHVSYSRALRADETPDAMFSNRIVLIGARPMVGFFGSRQDELRSPMRDWGAQDRFMPSVEVHATQLINLLRKEWLRRLPSGWEAVLLLATAFALSVVLFRVRPLQAAGRAMAMEVVTVAVVGWAFQSRSFWFPWMIVAGGQIPFTLTGSILVQSLEWILQKRRFEADRKRAQAKIQEQAALIDKARDAILVRSLDGAILYANPSAERLYGCPLATMQRPDGSVLNSEKSTKHLALAEAAVRATGEWTGELTQQNQAGEEFTVESRWTLIRNESGRPESVLLINTDVTEKKQMELQFQRIQRMETMGSLAGGIAHDLNNALAPVLMGIQLLRQRGHYGEDARMLDLMESNTRRGAGMVKQVLMFSRGETENFEPLGLGLFIQEMKVLVKETFPSTIHIDTTVLSDLWTISGNATQIHQILLNLCVNARDAMPKGGIITLDLDNVVLSADELKDLPNLRPGRYVSLMVSDTGTGIPKEVKRRIFEPFFTTKPPGKGTGIGLSTCVNIIRSHGGGLRVTSEPGEGTTFEVLLPATEIAARPSKIAEAASEPRGNGELVLIADHEQALREAMDVSLTQYGYRVEATGTSPEAIARLRSDQDPVRILITGWNLPIVSGEHFLELVRSVRPRIPILVISNEAPPNPAGSEHQAIAVLPKPFLNSTLLQRMKNLLQRSHVDDTGAIPGTSTSPGGPAPG